jgi:hypothetical protein
MSWAADGRATFEYGNQYEVAPVCWSGSRYASLGRHSQPRRHLEAAGSLPFTDPSVPSSAWEPPGMARGPVCHPLLDLVQQT